MAIQHINDMHMSMIKYFCGHLVEIHWMYNAKIEDLPSGLFYLQLEEQTKMEDANSKVAPGISRTKTGGEPLTPAMAEACAMKKDLMG